MTKHGTNGTKRREDILAIIVISVFYYFLWHSSGQRTNAQIIINLCDNENNWKLQSDTLIGLAAVTQIEWYVMRVKGKQCIIVTIVVMNCKFMFFFFFFKLDIPWAPFDISLVDSYINKHNLL